MLILLISPNKKLKCTKAIIGLNQKGKLFLKQKHFFLWMHKPGAQTLSVRFLRSVCLGVLHPSFLACFCATGTLSLNPEPSGWPRAGLKAARKVSKGWEEARCRDSQRAGPAPRSCPHPPGRRTQATLVPAQPWAGAGLPECSPGSVPGRARARFQPGPADSKEAPASCCLTSVHLWMAC